MKRLNYIRAAFNLSVSILLLAACSPKGKMDSGQDNGFRAEMTEEEMQGGHVSFQIDKNFIVDADVTPKEKYKNGLSSYYLKHFCETDKKSEKKFLQAPTLSLHSFEEWEGMLDKVIPGEFEDDAFKLNAKNADIRQTYQGKDGSSYFFHAGWSNYTKGVAEKTGYNSFCATVDAGRPGHGLGLYNQAVSIRNYVRDYHSSNTPNFLQNAGESVEQVQAFLKEVTGRPIYEGYDFSVANEETISLLGQVVSWEVEEPENVYAAFYFYYAVDGLPFKDLRLNYIMENDDTADELCYWSSVPGDNLVGFSEHEQALVLDGSGILYLECSNMWDAGEIYKEKLAVVSPNEALRQVEEHYDRQIITGECEVTDIGLVYTGYFSDSADGKIRPTVSPFWEIKVYDSGIKKYVYFVYDAYTGECIREGM